MADEVKIGTTLNLKKGSGGTFFNSSFKGNIDGDASEARIVSVGTSFEKLSTISDVGSPEYIFIQNLDDTNFITIGTSTDEHFKLKPGEFCVFNTGGSDTYAKADTAACLVEYIITET